MRIAFGEYIRDYFHPMTQVKEKERMERQTSIWSIEPEPSDWESSTPNTRPLL